MSSYQISFYVTSQYGLQITVLVDMVVSQFHLTTKIKKNNNIVSCFFFYNSCCQ